jgi:O-antigen ligase
MIRKPRKSSNLLSAPFLGLIITVAAVPFEALSLLNVGWTVAKVAGAFTLASWVIDTLLHRKTIKLPFRLMYRFVFLELFLAWSLFVGVVVFDFGRHVSTWTTLAQVALLFPLTYLVVDSKLKFRVILWVIVISAAASACMAIVEIRGVILPGHRLEMEWLGYSRVGGGSTSPGRLAVMIAPALTLAIGLIFSDLSLWRRIWLVVLAVMIAVGLVTTMTRGAWLSVIISLVAWSVWSKLPNRGSRRRGGRISNMLMILIVAGVAIIVMFVATSQIEGYGKALVIRVQSILRYSEYESITVRLLNIPAGIQIMLDHPITGIGLNHETIFYPLYLTDPRFSRGIASHNWILEVGGQVGIFGLILYCLLWYRALKDIAKTNIAIYAFPLQLAIVTTLIASLTDFILLYKHPWILLGLAAVASREGLTPVKKSTVARVSTPSGSVSNPTFIGRKRGT